jgi:hypothetical protein
LVSLALTVATLALLGFAWLAIQLSKLLILGIVLSWLRLRKVLKWEC